MEVVEKAEQIWNRTYIYIYILILDTVMKLGYIYIYMNILDTVCSQIRLLAIWMQTNKLSVLLF